MKVFSPSLDVSNQYMSDIVNFRWGFACLNINNERIKKKCSDYKVRYCCAKEKRSYWKEWSEWSECSKSCGGGKSFRARECRNKGHAHCVGPPREEVDCKQINCPGDEGNISNPTF